MRDVAAQRRHPLVEAEHFVDAGSPARECAHGARAHCVDADAGGPEIVGHVFDTGIKRGLANTHDVVAGHDLLAAEVGEREDGGILGEDFPAEAADGQQAISAGLHGGAKSRAAAVGGIALEVFQRGVGDRVHDEVERSKLLLGPVHDGGDLIVAGNIHWHEKFRVWLRVGELGHAAAISLAFVVGPVG